MSSSSRYLRYSVTCPSGHTEIRGEVISGVAGEVEAADEVKWRRRFVCGYCKADQAPGRFLIRILVNEPMPSSERRDKNEGPGDTSDPSGK